nr:hypothetical protein Iba_chr02aCG11280 [Ipomoea batatas]
MGATLAAAAGTEMSRGGGRTAIVLRRCLAEEGGGGVESAKMLRYLRMPYSAPPFPSSGAAGVWRGDFVGPSPLSKVAAPLASFDAGNKGDDAAASSHEGRTPWPNSPPPNMASPGRRTILVLLAAAAALECYQTAAQSLQIHCCPPAAAVLQSH